MTTDERLEKVEGQLARVKWFNRCLMACIVLPLVVWFMWRSFRPETAWAQAGVKEIRANGFVVEDENGKTRASLILTESGPQLQLLDENGKSVVLLSVSKEGPSIGLTDENGKPRAVLRVAKDKPSLSLHDENGKERATLMVGIQGPYLTLYDENDKLRADLSVSEGGSSLSLSDENGEERAALGMYDKPDLVLFDENGELIWAAP
jgi:hypothetical protein